MHARNQATGLANNTVDESGATDAGATNDSAPRITSEQVAALRRDGFLLVEGLSTEEEIASLRTVYDRLFSEKRGWETGDLFDMVGRDNLEAGLALPQLLWPSRYEPELKQSKLATNARAVAEQILGPKVENMLEHAIMKPAANSAATPWHQDDAFNRKGSGYLESISIWMPLQDVTVESGCMQYIRGSNQGRLYPHKSPNNDPRIHGLETVSPPDMSKCVPVPMRVGSGVVHLSRTIHGAGVNLSGQVRRAYVLGYAVEVRRYSLLARDYPWNIEKQTAREERELARLPPMKRTVRRLKRMLRGRKF